MAENSRSLNHGSKNSGHWNAFPAPGGMSGGFPLNLTRNQPHPYLHVGGNWDHKRRGRLPTVHRARERQGGEANQGETSLFCGVSNFAGLKTKSHIPQPCQSWVSWNMVGEPSTQDCWLLCSARLGSLLARFLQQHVVAAPLCSPCGCPSACSLRPRALSPPSCFCPPWLPAFSADSSLVFKSGPLLFICLELPPNHCWLQRSADLGFSSS